MEVPTIVKIGALRFEVREVENLKVDEEELLGHIKHTDCLMLLDIDQSRQTKAHTIWHEIIHELIYQAGHVISDETTNAIASGVLQVLCDNPELRLRPPWTFGLEIKYRPEEIFGGD